LPFILAYRCYLEKAFRVLFLREQMAKTSLETNLQLTYEMIPKLFADSMLINNSHPVEHFENVSILYADIVSFTTLCAKMNPDDVVAMLVQLFHHFDTFTSKLGLFKVQTIGDAYVVASGLPYTTNLWGQSTIENNNINHTHRLLLMAQHMKNHTENLQVRTSQGNIPIRIRIGIHHGEVVGSVLGTKALRYDIFGRDVLVANQIESIGIPGQVIVSQQVIKALPTPIPKLFKFTPHQPLQLNDLTYKCYRLKFSK